MVGPVCVWPEVNTVRSRLNGGTDFDFVWLELDQKLTDRIMTIREGICAVNGISSVFFVRISFWRRGFWKVGKKTGILKDAFLKFSSRTVYPRTTFPLVSPDVRSLRSAILWMPRSNVSVIRGGEGVTETRVSLIVANFLLHRTKLCPKNG